MKILLAGVLAVWTRRRWQVVRVRGTSMSPTYRDGARLLVRRRRGGRFRRDDVVLFEAPATWVDGGVPESPTRYRIKRIVAIEGDPAPAWLGKAPGSRVPPGCVVVAGDNAASEDSRHVGYVRTGQIRGTTRKQPWRA